MPPRVAIVTGAAQGIGRAIAHRLARDGFAVSLSDLPGSMDKLRAVEGEVAGLGGRAAVVACDVASKTEVDALVRDTVSQLGKLDVMIANAGIAPTDSFLDITPELLDRVHATNTRGTLLLYQAAARQFIAQGSGGKLIAACSVAGIEAFPQLTVYSASKFALRAINQNAARELGKHGITANLYCPGPVITPMWEKIDKEFGARAGTESGGLTESQSASNPMLRNADPEDVANLVSFLSGPDSNFVSGQAYQVNGGSWVS